MTTRTAKWILLLTNRMLMQSPWLLATRLQSLPPCRPAAAYRHTPRALGRPRTGKSGCKRGTRHHPQATAWAGTPLPHKLWSSGPGRGPKPPHLCSTTQLPSLFTSFLDPKSPSTGCIEPGSHQPWEACCWLCKDLISNRPRDKAQGSSHRGQSLQPGQAVAQTPQSSQSPQPWIPACKRSE